MAEALVYLLNPEIRGEFSELRNRGVKKNEASRLGMEMSVSVYRVCGPLWTSEVAFFEDWRASFDLLAIIRSVADSLRLNDRIPLQKKS